jgi:hypothetical protein
MRSIARPPLPLRTGHTSTTRWDAIQAPPQPGGLGHVYIFDERFASLNKGYTITRLAGVRCVPTYLFRRRVLDEGGFEHHLSAPASRALSQECGYGLSTHLRYTTRVCLWVRARDESAGPRRRDSSTTSSSVVACPDHAHTASFREEKRPHHYITSAVGSWGALLLYQLYVLCALLGPEESVF